MGLSSRIIGPQPLLQALLAFDARWYSFTSSTSGFTTHFVKDNYGPLYVPFGLL